MSSTIKWMHENARRRMEEAQHMREESAGLREALAAGGVITQEEGQRGVAMLNELADELERESRNLIELAHRHSPSSPPGP